MSNNLSMTFPQKLHELISDTANIDIIRWVNCGTAFKIINSDGFENQIVPKYFRHTKLTSFQRQLNLYGFRRMTKGDYQGSYFHSKFLESRKDLLPEVRRVNNSKSSSKFRLGSDSPNSPLLSEADGVNSLACLLQGDIAEHEQDLFSGKPGDGLATRVSQVESKYMSLSAKNKPRAKRQKVGVFRDMIKDEQGDYDSYDDNQKRYYAKLYPNSSYYNFPLPGIVENNIINGSYGFSNPEFCTSIDMLKGSNGGARAQDNNSMLPFPSQLPLLSSTNILSVNNNSRFTPANPAVSNTGNGINGLQNVIGNGSLIVGNPIPLLRSFSSTAATPSGSGYYGYTGNPTSTPTNANAVKQEGGNAAGVYPSPSGPGKVTGMPSPPHLQREISVNTRSDLKQMMECKPTPLTRTQSDNVWQQLRDIEKSSDALIETIEFEGADPPVLGRTVSSGSAVSSASELARSPYMRGEGVFSTMRGISEGDECPSSQEEKMTQSHMNLLLLSTVATHRSLSCADLNEGEMISPTKFGFKTEEGYAGELYESSLVV